MGFLLPLSHSLSLRKREREREREKKREREREREKERGRERESLRLSHFRSCVYVCVTSVLVSVGSQGIQLGRQFLLKCRRLGKMWCKIGENEAHSTLWINPFWEDGPFNATHFSLFALLASFSGFLYHILVVHRLNCQPLNFSLSLSLFLSFFLKNCNPSRQSTIFMNKTATHTHTLTRKKRVMKPSVWRFFETSSRLIREISSWLSYKW